MKDIKFSKKRQRTAVHSTNDEYIQLGRIN